MERRERTGRQRANKEDKTKRRDAHSGFPGHTSHTHVHRRACSVSLPLKAQGQGLIVPGMCVAARLFHRSQNSLMRLWPLPVRTPLPGLSFDKADGPSGTSYQVFLLFLLNPAVVLLFHGKQSGAKVSGLCPWGGHRPSHLPGGQGKGRSGTGDAGPGHRQWRGGCLAGSLAPVCHLAHTVTMTTRTTPAACPVGLVPSQALDKDNSAQQHWRPPFTEDSAGSEG